MPKFSALSIRDLMTAERNRGRIMRRVQFVVCCEADDGSWFELDADTSAHAKRLAACQVEKMNCRGASCWIVGIAGVLRKSPFHTQYASYGEAE